jgi:predicted DNA-binding ribbon-helix-helix protein
MTEPVLPDGTMRIRKHSLVIKGHSTSISLEDAFWTALRDISERRGMALAALVADIDAMRGSGNLSSAIRVFVLQDLEARVAQ